MNISLQSKSGITAIILTIMLTSACEKMIIFKPRVHIDPLPKTKSEETMVQADPMVSEQWYLSQIGITPEYLETGSLEGNYNVKVAILSTGIDYNHEDLIGQVSINHKEITNNRPGLADHEKLNYEDDDNDGLVDNVVGWDYVEGDGLAYDRHGAGTAVAGIIGAKQNNGIGITGMMNKVSLYPIRYIDSNGHANVVSLIVALDHAAKVKPDVIYLQSIDVYTRMPGFGGPVDETEIKFIEKSLKGIQDLGIPVIVGAGETMGEFGTRNIEKTFLGFDNVVVVTSTNKTGQKSFLAARGFDTVMTAAPGDDILTTKPNNTYGSVNGTAYAAAMVAGAYAQAVAKIGNRVDYQELNSLVLSGPASDRLPDLIGINRGGNKINVQKLLSHLDGY
jgi:subtilisin family serine protease